MSGGRENLISLGDRTAEERAKIGSKGGKMSGESKRRKKALREFFSDYMYSKISEEDRLNAEKNNLSTENIDNRAMLAFASCMKKIYEEGNAAAFEKIVNMAGELSGDNKSGSGETPRALIYLPEENETDGTEDI